MSEENFIGTNVGKEFGSILKNINVKETETESSSVSDKRPVLEGANDLGASATTRETAGKEKADPKMEKIKKLTLQKIEDLKFDIKELERKGEKGYEILAENKEKELKELESKINNSNKTKETVEFEIGTKTKPVKSEPTVPEPENKPRKPRAGFKIIQPAKQEKGQDLENEFEQKYPDILKTKRFNEKGDELYIQEYDKGKIKCFITENGKTSPIYLSLAQFDDALLKYARVEESIKKIIPAKEVNQGKKPEKEKMIANLPEKITNVFLQNATKVLKSFESDLSGKDGGENFLNKYANADKQQMLKLLVKPILQEFVDSKRKTLTEKFGFSEDNEKELISYVLESIIK